MSNDKTLGVLDLTDRGAGFLRRREQGYLPGPNDIHVNPRLIKEYGLRVGDEVAGEAGRQQGRGRGGRNPTISKIESINGRPPAELRGRPDFNRLQATHPDEPLKLDCGLERGGQRDLTNRIIDVICPFGKGQRALIVAPAKAGKTMVLQSIAEGLGRNHPECTLYILLVDERPE
ncbi:MAG: transcription termination factor Rho, partial [Gemmatimonadales bacterium]